MTVIRANIQTVEDIYRLIWTAIAEHRCVSAMYDHNPRLFCPHRLGRSASKRLRVLSYQYGGKSSTGLGPAGSPDNWRCMVLEKLSHVEFTDDPWQTAPNHARTASCIVETDIDAEDHKPLGP